MSSSKRGRGVLQGWAVAGVLVLAGLAGSAHAARVASAVAWTGTVGNATTGGGIANATIVGGSGFTVSATTNANNFIGIGNPATLGSSLSAAETGVDPAWYAPNMTPTASRFGFNVVIVGTTTFTGNTVDPACNHAAGSAIGSIVTCHATSTFTITFKHPVTNPVLHVSRLGGNSSFGSAPNIAEFNVIASYKLLTPNSGVNAVNSNGRLAVIGGDTITTAPLASGVLLGGSTAAVFCSAANGTACGSVQVNGTFTSLSFQVAFNLQRVSGTVALNSGGALVLADASHWMVTVPEDYGDAPASYDPGTNDASHILTDLRLGAAVTADNATLINTGATASPFAGAAMPNPTASGDASDDGASVPATVSSVTGASTTIPVVLSGASKAGTVCGWIDFNRNGAFAATEGVCQAFAAGATSANLVFTTPAASVAGGTVVRIRASYDAMTTASFTGLLDSGEVEDYVTTLVAPPLRLQKSLPSGRAVAADQFTLNMTGMASLTTTGAGSTATGVLTHSGTLVGTAYTLSETAAAGANLANYTTTYACTNAFAGGQTPSGTGTTFTVTPAASDDLTCTFSNARLPTTIRLQKSLPNGRVLTGDQFSLSMTGSGAPAAVVTTGTGATVTSAALTHSTAVPGSAYTLAEAASGTTVLANYTSTYSCTNARAGGQTPSGSGTSFSVTPVTGDDLTCTFSNANSQPSFGSCSARMFLVQVNAALTVSTLYDVGYTSTPFTFASLGTGAPYNGIGYNPLDNYVYGIEWGGGNGNELIRVGSNGSTVNLGVITGLPVTNYNNGVISPAGDYYLISGFGSTTLYRVNVTTQVATPITMTRSVMTSDLTWYNGLLYGIDSSLASLVSINPVSGVVTTIGSSSPVNNAISMWGFTNGLFAGTGSSIYAIDPATGAATLMSSTPAASNADGANCTSAAISFPGDLSVTKTNTPASGPIDLASDTYVPGETRTYSVVVTNNSGSFGAQNIRVSDPVPAGIAAGTVSWTCAATTGAAVCGAASGTGALNDLGLKLPPNAVATYLVTMTVPAGFPGPLTNTVTITPPNYINDTNAANNTATDTDLAAARVTVSKISLGGVGAFGFTGSNGIAAQTLTTLTAGAAVSGTPQVLTAPGTATTLTEGAPPAGYALSGISCTGLPGGTATPDLVTRTVTLDAAATATGANITCTFTNTLAPQLRLQKTLPSGRAVAADQFTLNMTGMASLTTTGAGSTATGVLAHSGALAGTAYTLSETAAAGANLANYTTAYSCTNTLAGGQTPGGTGISFTVTPVAGDDLTCTLANTAATADLQVVKTASPAGALQVGDVVTYTLVATNNGPSAANNAVITDAPNARLNCAAPSTTAACTAAGGASCPSATVPVASLTGAGITLPLFPNGGSVSLVLQCTVLP